MYVNVRQLGGLGLPPLVVPVAVAVLKNLNIFKMFGGKLIHGLKRSEFGARHDHHTWFRALWYDGYWAEEGAAEIPSGLTTQDYYINRFRTWPFFAHGVALDRLRRGGSPDSSLRLTSIPAGMPWPPDIGRIPLSAIQRVLPRGYSWDPVNKKAIPPSAVIPAYPGAPDVATMVPALPVGISELLRSPVVLVGLGLVGFFVMKTMMRPERS